jgi:predicted O-linked N-acetylglucosamine transferase (SPINDLY family)
MTPFHALTLPFEPPYILQLAKAYAANALRSAAMNQLIALGHSFGKKVPSTLRIGYLSCDFGDHPVGRLFAPVASHHSTAFQVFYQRRRVPHGRFDSLCERLSSTHGRCTFTR